MTRVLIVDDQAVFRQQLSSVLAYAGLEVIGEAASIQEALGLLPALRPELAVVDVEMPEINGIEGTVLLKQASPALRVILVSAYSDQSELFEQASARVGAEEFISKDHLDLEVIQSWKHLTETPCR